MVNKDWKKTQVKLLNMCVQAAEGILPCTCLHLGVCVTLKTKPHKRLQRTDKEEGSGDQSACREMGCAACALCQSWARDKSMGDGGKGWREGGLPEQTLWKKNLHRRRKRTRNKLRGNSIKKGGCQSGLSWLPHPVLCAKFQERLSPRSRVGGD